MVWLMDDDDAAAERENPGTTAPNEPDPGIGSVFTVFFLSAAQHWAPAERCLTVLISV